MTPVFEVKGDSLLLNEAGVVGAELLRKPVTSLRDRSHLLLVGALNAVIGGV